MIQKCHFFYYFRTVTQIVFVLMDDLVGLNHSLYMDNFYNSVHIAEDLLAAKTYLSGRNLIFSFEMQNNIVTIESKTYQK